MERGAVAKRTGSAISAGPSKGHSTSQTVPKELLRAALRTVLKAVEGLKQLFVMMARHVGVPLESLLRLPGVLGRALRALLSNKPIRVLLAAAASLICISLQCSRSTGASVQLSSSLSLLFGTVRVQGSMVIELGPLKALDGASSSQGEDIRISCPKDLKEHIVRFLQTQAARSVAEASASAATADVDADDAAGPIMQPWAQDGEQEEKQEEEGQQQEAQEEGERQQAEARPAAGAVKDREVSAAAAAELGPCRAPRAPAGPDADPDGAACDLDVEEPRAAAEKAEDSTGCDDDVLYGNLTAEEEQEAAARLWTPPPPADVPDVPDVPDASTWAVLACLPGPAWGAACAAGGLAWGAAAAAPRLPSTPSLGSSPAVREPCRTDFSGSCCGGDDEEAEL